jgi:hypothetical protein
LLALDLKWLRNGRAKIKIDHCHFQNLPPRKSETIMLSHLITTIVIVVLLAGTARAQVLPGDSPNMGVGAAVSGSRGLGVVSRPHTWEGYESQRSERTYSETVKRIPNKKPSNDPWKSVRQAPTATDRHQPQ